MDYKRPIKIDETGNFFTLIVTHNEEIQFDNLKAIFPFSYISNSKSKEGPSVFNHYDPGTRKRYEKFIRLKAHCVFLAERLNDNLRNFIRSYYSFKGKSTDRIYYLDFMQLRGELSDSLKDDERLRSIFKDGQEKNRFTKTFCNLIEDRNIYVHGDLHLRLDDGTIVIYHKDKNGDLASEVNEEIIQSFFDTCLFLNDHINKLWGLVNTGKL